MSELVVDTGAMRAHARRVEACASSLAEAADASGSVAIPDTSFGLLCSFLVPPAVLLQGLAAEAVDGASTAMNGIVTGLDASATAYDAVDDAVSQGMKIIEGILT